MKNNVVPHKNQSNKSKYDLTRTYNHSVTGSSEIADSAFLSWRSLSLCSSSRARELIPYHLAKELEVLPLGIREVLGNFELLIAASKDVSQTELKSKLKLITSFKIELYRIESSVLNKAIISAYKAHKVNEISKLEPDKSEENPYLRHLTVDLEKESEEPVPNVLQAVLSKAYQLNASDIHMLSQDENKTSISFRIDGKIVRQSNISISQGMFVKLIRHIKVLSGLDITENVAPQDGMFTFTMSKQKIRVRLSIIPNVFGVKLALRLLYHPILDELSGQVNSFLPHLGVSDAQGKTFLRALKKKGGLILLSGPTGSGKSTLLYSLLSEALKEDKNIISIEDPVERNVNGITQIEVSEHEKRSYHEVFKSLLRQDPDMIVISEIRDKKAAEIAIQAALSGCLVLSTIHASNVVELVLRLFEYSCSPISLGACLKVVSSQRLLPGNCPNCLKDLDNSESYNGFFNLSKDVVLKHSEGCSHCFGTGIKGRKAIFETCEPGLALISELSLIYNSGLKNTRQFNIRDLLIDSNYIPFINSLKELLIKGEVSPEEALSLNL